MYTKINFELFNSLFANGHKEMYEVNLWYTLVILKVTLAKLKIVDIYTSICYMILFRTRAIWLNQLLYLKLIIMISIF